MSANNQETNDSASRFTLIFQKACDEYKRLSGHDLSTHPFSLDCNRCNSPSDVLDVLRGQSQAFTRSREDNEKLLSWLNPIIHLLFTFSTTLGEGIGLVSLSNPTPSPLLYLDTVSAVSPREHNIYGRCCSSRGTSHP